MASNSRKARRDAIKQRRLYYSLWLRRFIAFAHNSVEIDNLGETPKRYFMKVLINEGAIAYDKETELYLRFVPIGYDVYGLPTEYQLYGYNGYTVTRKPEEVVILRINDIQQAIKPYLEMQTEKIVEFDMAIYQNLDAIKTMTVYECESDAQVLSMVNQAESRRVGATVFFANKSAFGGTTCKTSQTGATFLVDKLQQARQKEINETYAMLGMATANTEKRERVQGMEVSASLGLAIDSIMLNVDTFNYDAKYGGLKIRMKPNTSAITMWNKELENDSENKKDINKDKELVDKDKE